MKPFLTFNLFLLFIVAVSANAVCPDLKKNETKADCPWAAITRKILEPKNTCEDVLKSKLSYIVKQIERDKKSSEFSSLWGQAKNFDENAKAVIVDPKILNYLAKKLNLESSIQTHAGFDSVHAGLQHTYAYLFSQLETPYGYKRARWVTGEIEQGFGLSPKTFNPETNKGSFLANVTYFFAMFAFKEDVQFLQDLQKQGQKNKSVSAELIQL